MKRLIESIDTIQESDKGNESGIVGLSASYSHESGSAVHPTLTVTFGADDWEARDKLMKELSARKNNSDQSGAMPGDSNNVRNLISQGR